MNNTLNNVLIFTAGAVVGALVSWKILETRIEAKYEQITQEDVESFREVYTRMKNEHEAELEEYEAIERAKKPDLSEYRTKLAEVGYIEPAEETEEVYKVERPYVISPSEFGELDGYETVSLTYYKDGVLTTDFDDEEIDYVDDVVGLDSFNHFGEYEDSTVFVRNDRLKVDYEIMRDERNYSDVVNMSPHNVED